MTRSTQVLALLAVATVAAAQPAPAQDSRARAALAAELQGLVDRLVREHDNVPGAALDVEAPRLKLSWSGAAGTAEPAARTKLTPANPFRIASNTKTYVAAAILRLWENGKLRLDQPIASLISGAANQALLGGGYKTDRITVRHLLSHTSGLYDWGTDSAYFNRVIADPKHRWTRQEQVEFAMAHGSPYGQPGEVYHYSDTGYILLGEIIERTSGQSMPAAIRQLLRYDRLGLRSTWFETLEPAPAGAAPRAHQLQGPTDTYGFDPSLDLYGGGGLLSTAREMAVFTRGLFVGRVFDRKTTIDTMTAPVAARDQKGYALGIGKRVVNGATSYGHTGYWNTFSIYFPELDVAIAGSVMQNAEYKLATALYTDALALIQKQPAR